MIVSFSHSFHHLLMNGDDLQASNYFIAYSRLHENRNVSIVYMVSSSAGLRFDPGSA